MERGWEIVEIELIKLLIDKAPSLAIVMVSCVFGGKYITTFIKDYRILKNEKKDRVQAEEKALIQEGREFGHIESERDTYKSSIDTLRNECSRQREKINKLDEQVNELTHIVRTESDERKKDGERLDSLIRIHDNLSKNYSDMADSLKKSLGEIKEAFNEFQYNNMKMHEKMVDMEDDISSIKNDVKELKEIRIMEGNK